MPQLSKIEALLGFGIKSGKVQFGTDRITECAKRQYLILYDADLSGNTIKKLQAFASKHNIPVFTSPVLLCELIHRDGVKAVSLQNSDMAKEIIKQLSQ